MKTKTSVTLSPEVLKGVDQLAGSSGNRSAVIERVLRAHFRRRARALADERDFQRLNHAAARLNREANDVLSYQSVGPGE